MACRVRQVAPVFFWHIFSAETTTWILAFMNSGPMSELVQALASEVVRSSSLRSRNSQHNPSNRLSVRDQPPATAWRYGARVEHVPAKLAACVGGSDHLGG